MVAHCVKGSLLSGVGVEPQGPRPQKACKLQALSPPLPQAQSSSLPKALSLLPARLLRRAEPWVQTPLFQQRLQAVFSESHLRANRASFPSEFSFWDEQAAFCPMSRTQSSFLILGPRRVEEMVLLTKAVTGQFI